MAANLYTQQSSNIGKTWALMGVFFMIVICLGWFLRYYYEDQSILVIAVLFSIFMNIGSYWFSDKIVLAMSGAREISKESHYEYFTLVENLTIAAGLPMPKLYVIEESAPNAFATGRDKNHSAVAVTTGLLQILDRTELEGVLAHELAHIGNRDILLQTVIVVLVGFITLIADFFFRSGLLGGDRREGGHPALMIIGIALMILSPIIATVIQLAISRKREFLADATGALITRYPEGLANALLKIEQHAHTMKRANHATAHLFISDPFAEPNKKKIGFFHKMFMTHPPTQERIAALRGVEIQ